MVHPTPRLFLPLAALATLAALTPAQNNDEDEFSAHGINVLRIEHEAKLVVPRDRTDTVWQWLQQRYRDCSWLDQLGHRFRADFGNEDFTDTYFDTSDLKLLAEQSGVRHRSRVVNTGPARHKDGRELLQIKLNRHEENGLARSEIKFAVEPAQVALPFDDISPVLGLVAPEEREDCKARLRDLGLNPYDMRPILTVKQNRRRVYVSDQGGSFATLTLDSCSSDSWGTDLHFTEIELELNEIRFTEEGTEGRNRMESLELAIQEDLQEAFPDIVQDQTPKYNKTFAAIEASTWLPLRSLIQWGIGPLDFVTMLAVGLLTLTGGAWLVVRQRRRCVRAAALAAATLGR